MGWAITRNIQHENERKRCNDIGDGHRFQEEDEDDSETD